MTSSDLGLICTIIIPTTTGGIWSMLLAVKDKRPRLARVGSKITILLGLAALIAAGVYAFVMAPQSAQAEQAALAAPLPAQPTPFPGEKEAKEQVSKQHPVKTWGVEPGRVAVVAVAVSRGLLTDRFLVLRYADQATICRSDCGTELLEKASGQT